MSDGDKEINLIKNTVELSGNISITSMAEVTTNNASGEKTADRNQIIQPMENGQQKQIMILVESILKNWNT